MADQQFITVRMASLVRQWEMNSDRRMIFLNCYLLMTQNMLKAIEAGEFNDPDWVRILLHRFAEYYFEALNAYELNPPAAPAVWRLAHNAAREPETLVLQNLFLGINAHINYDLVLTVADLLGPEWGQLSIDRREQHHTDYCHVNQIIQRTIDAVQDEVIERYSPLMDMVDKLLGPLDEWLISQLITSWRDEVWDKAVDLMSTAEAADYQRLLNQLEADTLKRAEAILLQ